MGSPTLIYNGSEDRYGTFITSELHFNMLVKTNTPAHFLHLFTGNETRYKVRLSSIDENTLSEDIVFEGFLLPEQFEEPYLYNNFFVEFVATDGVGRLKTKKLPNDFYQQTKSVPEIIAACLKQTGLEYPLRIAPAVANAVVDLKVKDIWMDTSCYVDTTSEKEKKKRYL